MNIEVMKVEYEEQLEQLLRERSKIEEIIVQLEQDYREVYEREEVELGKMRVRN